MKKILKDYLFRALKVPRFDSSDLYLDHDEFNYICRIYNLYNKIKSVPGHIIELGVGKGRNAILFSNFFKAYNHYTRTYFGFDTFKSYTPEDFKKHKYLNKNRWADNSLEYVKNRIDRLGFSSCVNFIEGDIRITLPKFLENSESKYHSKGSLQLALVYIDTSTYDAAYLGLEELSKKMMPGGIISIDQKTQGAEWEAMKDFAQKKNLKIELDESPFTPPAIIKF